jgi:hypothetical protein
MAHKSDTQTVREITLLNSRSRPIKCVRYEQTSSYSISALSNLTTLKTSKETEPAGFVNRNMPIVDAIVSEQVVRPQYLFNIIQIG